ncbi:phospholipase C, phosphocholine-specific [soil metagenome]
MNSSRRDFLKKAALLAGGTCLWNILPASVYKAMSINPELGSTFYDAKHVVMLMQENRSFDHCFGALKGVRGFNDPRAISLPNKNKVWLQPDDKGNIFAPFHLDIKDTKATWMSSIPHSWENQVDARNIGKYDGWIEAKRSGHKEYRDFPLTMGYYNREDLPFYYALADSFTICDQHFCSSLTGTTTNRNYFWAGKTHGEKGDKAKVRNSDITYGKEVSWNTFPERLEEHNISWKVYQNELSIKTELTGEDESLLANFTDNNLEWFSQFGVRYSPGHYAFLRKSIKELPGSIKALEKKLKIAKNEEKEALQKEILKNKELLQSATESIKIYNPDNYKKLSEKEKQLHQRAFCINTEDPNYHQTLDLHYEDNGEKRSVKIPKGDILHQFRKDVESGSLPTVSWLVAPQKFSDHPSAPWYGAWYVSEVLEILTKNPEVWKKTIFILNYDENDGYFDHIPPFIPPKPGDPDAGKMSNEMDATGEYVTLEEELNAEGLKPQNARESPVGLGYRVPLIVASPWSRGGWVNSEVCDITSTIMFLENFLSKKTGQKIEESNISSWRRNICGDLTSAFQPYNGEIIDLPDFLNRERYVKSIYNAQFKDLPVYRSLTIAEASEANSDPFISPFLPRQEPGTKPSSALKYELMVEGGLSENLKHFEINLEASNKFFGKEALGAPFNVYAPGNYLHKNHQNKLVFEPVKTWAFAVKAGDSLKYQWPLDHFEDQEYHLRVYGPNGFFREFIGNRLNPNISVSCQYLIEDAESRIGNVAIRIKNQDPNQTFTLVVSDHAYGQGVQQKSVAPLKEENISIATKESYGWYDFSVKLDNFSLFEQRYGGRVEFGKPSQSDPQMGKLT